MAKEGKKLVVVESPTKAKTIRKFLGKEFVVESCMGHIRDLPQSAKDIPEKFKKEKWANLGVNVDNDFDPVYCVPRTKTRIVKTLKEKLAEVDELILATDEDREGESISWHLVEVLKPKVPVKRMVFHEITKEAIQGALSKFRDIDENLVRAQEARRILDRLVGYTLSPLLWKKVAYGLSAGRVQSVAVRLISEREHERIRFKKSHYWAVTGKNKKDTAEFESRLHAYKGMRIATGRDFDGQTGQLLADKKAATSHLFEADAKLIVSELKGQPWIVDEVEEKPVSRKPYPPFITSTLQQEANRKLGMSSRETMEMAQKLYERGFITYMRTDSPFLSQQAVQAARETIKDQYGANYLPSEPREYSAKKSKGAQEAHEAIRPAGTSFIRPEDAGLSGGMLKIYELIWKRTIASQMVNSQQKQVSVKFKVGDAIFAASGMTVEFPGFLKVYTEEEDDDTNSKDENREVRLPQLKVNDKVDCTALSISDHETKPPARYTEASLVQTLEKEGIGRPSTYATIISTIQDRGYVKKVGNALVPTFTALVVSKLLSKYLPNYVDLKFTSEMEERLDDIANGDLNSTKYLGTIYFGNTGLKSQVEKQEKAIDGEESRSINLEGLNNLSFRIGRYGAYVCRTEGKEEVCASLPDNQFPGDMTSEVANKLIDQKVSGADALGKDPVTGLPVYVLSGRYGPYVQLGEVDEVPDGKPKRMAIPATMDPATLKLDQALSLLELPKTLGTHPETGKEIKKGLGRFGPYIVHDGDFRSIPKTDNIFAVDLKRALEMLAQPKKMRGRSTPLRELGKHPESQDEIQVFSGKYGPYIKVGKTNISLPDDIKPEDITVEQALKLIAEKADIKASKAKGKGKAGPKKAKSPAAASVVAEPAAAASAPKAPAKGKVIIKKASANPTKPA
jgi:DNA topoisomerase-1